MEIVKGYSPMMIDSERINDTIKVKLGYGDIEGPYYNQELPEENFDTEEDAIDYTYKKNKYATWVILPTIKFK